MIERPDCNDFSGIASETLYCYLAVHRMRTCLANIVGISEGFQAGVYGNLTESQSALLAEIENSGYDLLNAMSVLEACPHVMESPNPNER